MEKILWLGRGGPRAFFEFHKKFQNLGQQWEDKEEEEEETDFQLKIQCGWGEDSVDVS